MTKLITCTLGAAVLLMFAGNGSPAKAQPVYPWCAHYSGNDVGGAINCGFSTREQCMAAVSGVGGTCEVNVNWPPSVPPQPRAPKRQ